VTGIGEQGSCEGRRGGRLITEKGEERVRGTGKGGGNERFEKKDRLELQGVTDKNRAQRQRGGRGEGKPEHPAFSVYTVTL